MTDWDADLYNRYSGDVYRFALYLCGDRAEAEDVVAETFVRLWTSRTEIRMATVKAYLLTIARRLCVDAGRRARRFGDLPHDLSSPEASPEHRTVQRSHLAGVWRSLRDLSERDRTALLMRLGGLTYDEIGESLSISTIAAKVRVHRARKTLLRILEIPRAEKCSS